MSVIESVKRVKILFKYMPFLPPPSSKNMTYDQADWKKRNLSIDKATICRCQFHALPESYQQKLLDDPVDWKAMEEVIWLDRLLRAKEIDKVIMAPKERIAKAASSTSRTDNTSHTKRHKKNLKPKSAKEKTAQGKACYCSMCKNAGMPEGKWKSHHTNDCMNQGDYEQKLSSNAKSNSDAKAQYKREVRKKLQKATKLATSKLKKFAKAAKSAKSGKELMKFQKSLSKGKKKRSKSSSDDSDESGQISESSSSSDASDSSSASSY